MSYIDQADNVRVILQRRRGSPEEVRYLDRQRRRPRDAERINQKPGTTRRRQREQRVDECSEPVVVSHDSWIYLWATPRCR